MKKIFTLLFSLAILSYSAQSTKQIFEAPNLKELAQTHKMVAILPFETRITYKKLPKNYNEETNKEQEKTMAKNIQSSMYTFLLRKNKNYTVSFQDIEKTNTLLKKAGMLSHLDDFTKDEIAKALGVDAVLGGKFETIQTRSEAGAIVTTVLFGGLGSKTGSGTLTLLLNNANDGEMIWRFAKSMDDDIFSSTDVLIERMMRKVSRNFPYEKS
ncbi:MULTISPECIES: hypothetical protein [Elizabethkingia]|uniref:hypothetical protein n=1 Tax=Elizabethkingia TaxID=308865 RepID=UPI00209EAE60|nr:hypothetical protein [Elizabethkingia sp. S0634]MCP1252274.1 hypothetical protein [Elizabethkingia sp. S0634]